MIRKIFAVVANKKPLKICSWRKEWSKDIWIGLSRMRVHKNTRSLRSKKGMKILCKKSCWIALARLLRIVWCAARRQESSNTFSKLQIREARKRRAWERWVNVWIWRAEKGRPLESRELTRRRKAHELVTQIGYFILKKTAQLCKPKVHCMHGNGMTEEQTSVHLLVR